MSWRCPDCGNVYTAPGECGRNMPRVCRAALVEFDDNAAVVAALRLAVAGAPDGDRFLGIARVLLEEAPPTPPTDVEGPRLLVEAIRAGRLKAVLTDGSEA